MQSFNTIGPKCIPIETFQRYQQLQPQNGKHWTIDELFYFAIDENHSTNLRLLAWRDLLFQYSYSPSSIKKPIYWHDTGANYSDILHIGEDSETGAALRHAFAGRPKLVHEFSAQLKYNLDYNLMHRKDYQNVFTDACDDFIEILLPLVGESLSRAIWHHHSCSFVRDWCQIETFQKYLNLCSPQANMPQWLVHSLQKKILNAITIEGNTAKTRTNTTTIINNYHENLPATSALIDHLLHLDRQKQADLITKYVKMLEQFLPQNYLYFDIFYLERIAPVLQDAPTTYRTLVRHLAPLLNKQFTDSLIRPSLLIKSSENFLLWAAGFAQLNYQESLQACAEENRLKATEDANAEDSNAEGSNTEDHPETHAEQNQLLSIITTLYESAKLSGQHYIY